MLVKSQVKYIQSLGQKKFRDQEGVFVAEGPKIVSELLTASNVPLVTLYAVKEWLEKNHESLVSFSSPQVVEVRDSELERLSSLATPNQVVAVFGQPSFTALPPRDSGRIRLLLDSIQDPGNLGTIVRIADWFGLRHVVCSPESADVFNAKAVQSTMGSISRVRVTYEDPEEHIGRDDLPAYATTLGGTSLYKMERIDAGIIVIGNESKGIRDSLLQKISHHITIPRIGEAESLNAAVATGIVLSHLVSSQ
ncbi:MAG: RNA methyltransferase [Puia sp.]|nr:RNA methyltransferase [Puia sp.]